MAQLRARTYERYSSDNQRPASIDDQRRGNLAFINRQPGWSYAGSYSDSEMSGATKFRPDYQRMLTEARAGEFDVLVVESLDRVGRDLEETAGLYKRLTYFGIKLYATDDGLVTDLHVGMKGTMDWRFLKDLSAKVHRGLHGRVLAGKSGGGLCFGYRVVKQLDAKGDPIRGEREIDEAEAAMVRRIFAEYADGRSPITITQRLNAEGVAGPHGRGWGPSTIHGHKERGTGILNNELYLGRLVWNRQRYMRDPDTGKRVSRMNPPEAWIIQDVPELRIVDDELWHAVKARQTEFTHLISDAGKAAIRLSRANRVKTLLSGLLVCDCCGGPYTSLAADRIGCRSHRLRAGCGNTLRVSRRVVEARVLAGIKEKLLAPEAIRIYVAEFIAETNRLNADQDRRRVTIAGELKAVERKIAAIMAAIEDGIRTPTTHERLLALEADKGRLETELAAAPASPIAAIHPGIAEQYRRAVAELETAVTGEESKPAAAEALRRLVTEVRIGRSDDGEMTLTVHGELGALLNLGQKHNAGPEGTGAWSALVAGARSQRRPPAAGDALAPFKIAV